MSSTSTKSSGSAQRWGALWAADPRAWAGIEDQQRPTYDEALRRAGLNRGDAVLDIGCGTGAFLLAAAERGARVFGLDASDSLLALARQRVPDADLRVGEMEQLPYDGDSFDLVTGFNSFFFAADMVSALREAARVAKPGAPVVIQVWGRPERCDLEAMKRAVARLLPASEPEGPPQPLLWEPGALEDVARAAGLAPVEAFDTTWAYEFPDGPALVRAMLSAAPIALAARTVGEQAVGAAILDALAPQREADGSYRLLNEFHFLLARA